MSSKLSSRPTTLTITAGPGPLPWAPLPGIYTDASIAPARSVDPCPSNRCVYSGTQGMSAVFSTWNGGAFAPTLGSHGAMLYFGGGHFGYDGNSVFAFDVGSRSWIRLSEPAPYGTRNSGDSETVNVLVDRTGAFPDGSPYPNHTNMACDFLPPEAGGGPLGSYVFMGHDQTGVNITSNNLWRSRSLEPQMEQGRRPAAAPRRPAGHVLRLHATWPVGARFAEQSRGRPTVVHQCARCHGESDWCRHAGRTGRLRFIRQCHLCSFARLSRDRGPRKRSTPPVRRLERRQRSQWRDGTVIHDQAVWSRLRVALARWERCDVAAVRQFRQARQYCSLDGNLYALDLYSRGECRLFRLAPPDASRLQTDPWTWTSEVLAPRNAARLALKNLPYGGKDDARLFGKMRFVPGIKSFVFCDGADRPAQALRPLAFA